MFQVGDQVEITMHINTLTGVRVPKRNRVTQTQTVTGKVLWTSPKFCTVELQYGYRESFWHDELTLVQDRKPKKERVAA